MIKKFYKKLSSVALLLFASSLSFAQTFVVDGISYKITSPTTVEIANNQGNYAGDIQIPSSVIDNSNTYAVTSIGISAFSICPGLTSISIPNSVTTVKDYAFAYSKLLTSITLPNAINSVMGSVFEECSGLKSIAIPNSVTSIGVKSFMNCTGLTSITFSNSLVNIENYAFQNCAELTSIELPNSVTNIGMGAFIDCIALTTFKFPVSVINIPSYAFYRCSGLKSIDIPKSITSIGTAAFGKCAGLTSITANQSLPLVIANEDFLDAYPATLYVPTGSVAAYQTAIEWGKFNFIVVMIAGDINRNGIIESEYLPDEFRMKSIQYEIAGDVNLNGIIDGQEMVGDLSGNFAIESPDEVLGDYNGNGLIDLSEMSTTAVSSNTITSNFSICPNPATDNVTISFTESVSGTVSIVDLHGNVVATKSISGTTSNISTSDLSIGVYIVKISTDKGVAVKQLVVQ